MESEIKRNREKDWRRRNGLKGMQRGGMNWGGGGALVFPKVRFFRRFIIPKHKFPMPTGS